MLNSAPVKILFVCSMNQWRSPTAERIYSNHQHVVARSCGTNRGARVSVSSKLIQWADVIIVMEQKHKNRLLANFPGDTKFKTIHVLDIPDDYQFMDDDLIKEIESAVAPIIEEHLSN